MSDIVDPHVLAAAALDAAIDEFRDLLRGDGADLTVEARSGDAIVLRLVLETAGCAECVMPRAHLERVARDIFEGAGAGVHAVTVIDPRETPSID